MRPFVSLLTPGALFLAGSFMLAGCDPEAFSDDVEATASPTPTLVPCADREDPILASPPTTWGQLRQLSAKVLVYAQGDPDGTWYPQITRAYSLVKWDPQPGGTITQEELICQIDYTDVEVQVGPSSTVFGFELPAHFYEYAPEDSWSVQLKSVPTEGSETCGVSYTTLDSRSGPLYQLWGTDMNDPVNEVCPSDPLDPAQADTDKDFEPGVTIDTYWDGDYYFSNYICQRQVWRQAEATLSQDEDQGYVIEGAIHELVVDQSQYGASSPSVSGYDPEVDWYPNDETFFRLVALPEGATCADVYAALAPEE